MSYSRHFLTLSAGRFFNELFDRSGFKSTGLTCCVINNNLLASAILLTRFLLIEGYPCFVHRWNATLHGIWGQRVDNPSISSISYYTLDSSYFVPCIVIAQSILAFLLASATAVRLNPRRSTRAFSHKLNLSCFLSQ